MYDHHSKTFHDHQVHTSTNPSPVTQVRRSGSAADTAVIERIYNP